MISFQDFYSLISEAVYKGNIGAIEVMKFFSQTKQKDPELLTKVKELIDGPKKDQARAWEIIQNYLNVKLKGNQFSS
jgi:hypothetical protein